MAATIAAPPASPASPPAVASPDGVIAASPSPAPAPVPIAPITMDMKEPAEGWPRFCMQLLMTNRFHDAARLCAAKFDTNPRLAVLHAYITFLKAVSSEGEEELAEALATAWRAEKIGRGLTSSSNPKTAIEGKLTSADGHLLGALIQVTQQSYVKAAWNMRKSWKWYQAVLTDLENYKGNDKEELLGWAYTGSGVFNLLVSILPPNVVRVAELIGFSGDRTLGITQLKQSQQSTSFFAPFSGLMLLNYYVTISVFTGEQNEAMLLEADNLLKWGLRTYPNGMFWATMESRYFRCRTDLRRAIDVAESAVVHSQELPAVAILLHYQKGWCAFFLLEWREAAEYFDNLLHHAPANTTTTTRAASPSIAALPSAALPSASSTTTSTTTTITPAPAPAVEAESAEGVSSPALVPAPVVEEKKEIKKETDSEIDRHLASKRRIAVQRASVQGFYAYHVAISYAAAGEWRRATWYFRSVPTWLVKNKMRPMDEYAKRKSEQWLLVKNPRQCDALLDAFELVHAWAGFAQMGGPQLTSALDQLIAAGRTQGSPEVTWKAEGLARYHLLTGAIYKSMGRQEEAMASISAILKVEDVLARDPRAKQNGVLAYAYHDLAALYVDQRLWTRAAAAHKKATAFDDYELYKAIQVRLHALRALITKGSVGTA